MKKQSAIRKITLWDAQHLAPKPFRKRRKRMAFNIAWIAVAVLLLSVAVAFAVNNETQPKAAGDQIVDADTLESAIAGASAGDTVTLEADISTEVTADTRFIIDKELTVDLNGHTIAVEGDSAISYSLFQLATTSTVTFVNGTLEGGDDDGSGGVTTRARCYAIYSDTAGSCLSMEGVTVEGFYANSTNYSAVHMVSGAKNLFLHNCVFQDNARTGFYFAGNNDGEEVTVQDCLFTHNRATGNGYSYANGFTILSATDVLIKDNRIIDNRYPDGSSKAHSGGFSTFSCKNVTVTGNTVSQNRCTGVSSWGGGGFSLCNTWGPIVVEDNEITDNRGYNWGGGFLIYNANFTSTTTEIHGNTIKDNYADYTSYNSGGQIHKNSFGGGFCIIDLMDDHDAGDHCYIYDNVIDGNAADPDYGRGGGMCFWGSDPDYEFKILSGTITNNSASWGGGIDFTYKEASLLRLYSAVITDNSAFRGGGIWLCPTSRTNMHETFGGAIYCNSATGEEDFAAVEGISYATGDSIRYEGIDSDVMDMLHTDYGDVSSSFASVSSRALGGELMDWYTDEVGGRYADGASSPVTDLSPYKDTNLSFGLHGELDDYGISLAEAEATTIIKNNTATFYGGGVASNSPIDFGVETEFTVNVSKVWQDADGNVISSGHPLDPVEVALVREDEDGNDIELEHVMLSEENGWEHTFVDLPCEYLDHALHEHDYSYKVNEENLPAGYSVSYEIADPVYDADGNGTQEVTVINTVDEETYEPEPDPEPMPEPDNPNPGDTDKPGPGDTDNPDQKTDAGVIAGSSGGTTGGSGGVGTSAGGKTLPQTGQLNWPVPVLCLYGAVFMVVGLLMLPFSRRKRPHAA